MRKLLTATAILALSASTALAQVFSGGPTTVGWMNHTQWGAQLWFYDNGWCEIDLTGAWAPYGPQGPESQIATLTIWEDTKQQFTYNYQGGTPSLGGAAVCTAFAANATPPGQP